MRKTMSVHSSYTPNGRHLKTRKSKHTMTTTPQSPSTPNCNHPVDKRTGANIRGPRQCQADAGRRDPSLARQLAECLHIGLGFQQPALQICSASVAAILVVTDCDPLFCRSMLPMPSLQVLSWSVSLKTPCLQLLPAPTVLIRDVPHKLQELHRLYAPAAALLSAGSPLQRTGSTRVRIKNARQGTANCLRF